MKWLIACLLLAGCSSSVCIVEHDSGSEQCDFDAADKTCEEVAEDYVERINTRLAECGVSVEGSDTTPPQPCDEAMKTLILCFDACTSRLSCGALDGSDLAALTAYSDCILACDQGA